MMGGGMDGGSVNGEWVWAECVDGKGGNGYDDFLA